MSLRSLTRFVSLSRPLVNYSFSPTKSYSKTFNNNNGISRLVINPLLCRNLSSELKKSLDEKVLKNDIVLFMKGTPNEPQCGFSRAVVQIFDAQAFDVLENEELRKGIKEYSNWPTVPQVYIKGEFVGGCDIMLNMHQSGELEDLLVKEGLISLSGEEGSAEGSNEQKQQQT
ncbi:2891_t:CDS:2 [Diversispora eburnea]|uniref:Monothiol glutaredoxin-5, mitochondrial n=1 Tax=Diversispora eburnea TaxID=1213867 RepID=A0A9N8VJW5_9GLOM|nr:2891_t:CDS:2 [Diversispora eburnea]